MARANRESTEEAATDAAAPKVEARNGVTLPDGKVATKLARDYVSTKGGAPVKRGPRR